PIRVWELVNEYSSTIPGNPGNSLPRTNFISMVIQGSLAIRSACPQAWFAYDPFDTSDTQALLQQMAYTNIDVISLHTYAPLDKPTSPSSAFYLPNITAYFQTTLGMTNLPRVWATEYAFYEHTGATFTNMVGTQTDNARWFVQTTVYALGSNLFERFIYTELTPPMEDDVRLKWMTPIDTNGVRRQLYYAYQKLSALIDRASVRQPLDLGANIWAYRFTANGTNVVVAWSSETNSPHTNVVISGLGTNTQGILVDAVPDTNGVFTSTNVTISGGQYTIALLSSNPVYLLVNAGTLAAPTGVSVGDGADTDRVQVAWSPVSDSSGSGESATGYQVWRNTLDSYAQAIPVGITTTTNYTDLTAAAGVTYYYWVKATNAALISAFSASDSGFVGVIGPLITANGALNNVTVNSSSPVTIAVAMNPGAYPTDVPVDWWIVAWAHSAGWYYLSSSLQWTPFSGDLAQLEPVYQGPLFDLSSTPVLNGITLPPGTYDFWFAVDYPMDGILNLAGPILYDQVTVVAQ
ncbi:MAG: hypothetical protein HYV36_08470, partial [Lentisphaerae bacterium]|nr:hypothetical protein [Lentisphaerota bacterium]